MPEEKIDTELLQEILKRLKAIEDAVFPKQSMSEPTEPEAEDETKALPLEYQHKIQKLITEILHKASQPNGLALIMRDLKQIEAQFNPSGHHYVNKAAKTLADTLRIAVLKTIIQRYGPKGFLELKKRFEKGQEIEKILDKTLTEVTWDELRKVENYRGKILEKSSTKRTREFTEGVDLTKDLSYEALAKIRLDNDPAYKKILELPTFMWLRPKPNNGSDSPIINIEKMEMEIDHNAAVLEEIKARQRAERKRLGLPIENEEN